jgi:NitT/TauT family transport system substrate-binding protein
VQVTPVKNADILMLFQLGKLDGAWVPEPWVTRLLREGGGRIFLEERTLWPQGKFPTAVVVARSEFIEANRDLVRRALDAHVEVTDWIVKNPAEARRRLNEQLGALIGKPLPVPLLEEASGRVQTTYDPMGAELLTSATWAADLGYLPRGVDLSKDLSGLIDTSLLNEVLKARSLPPVH